MKNLIFVFACLISVSVFGQGACNNQTSVTHQGYEYDIVAIGDQCWFAENCRYLPVVSPSSEGSDTSPYYYVYDYEGSTVEEAQATDNYATYGVLYNWPAVMTEGICPSGWHIPSEEEFTQLTDFLGKGAGYQMKSTSWWPGPNSQGVFDYKNRNGSNSSGFNGLPGGHRDSGDEENFLQLAGLTSDITEIHGGFHNIGMVGHWWSSTESGSRPPACELIFSKDDLFRCNPKQFLGFSARCVRD